LKPVTVKVRIIDNLVLDAMLPWRGYQVGDQLRCVHEAMAGFVPEDFIDLKAGLHAVADVAFAEFNKDERPTRSFCKSMSVGDIVQIHYGDGVMNLACGNLGWRDVGDIGDPPFDQNVGHYFSDLKGV
jgi:hypothetical protein